MKTKLLSVLIVFAMTITSAFAAWHPGLQWGSLSGSTMNKTDFPAVTNYSLTIDKAMMSDWPVNTTYVYWGKIYLDGSAYRFGENIDDEAMLKINGTTVFSDTKWGTPSFGTVELEAGWYDFELRMCNKSSGGGATVGNPAVAGFSSSKGFGYAKGTKEEMDAIKDGTLLVVPADTGDLTFLRYDDGLGFNDSITISALPYNFDTVVPAYGVTNDVTSGESIVFSAPAEVVLDNGVINFTRCRIYDVDVETNVETELADSPFVGEVVDGRRTFTYTHGEMMRTAVWEWEWTKVDVDAKCEPSFAGSITGGGEGCTPNEEITLTATANDGSVFVRWEGDVPEGEDAESPSIKVTPSEPMVLRAIFSNSHYVTPDAPALGAGGSWNAPTSLTNAFARAVSGDTIYLKAGTYSLGSAIDITDKVLSVKGGLLGNSGSDVESMAEGDSTIITVEAGVTGVGLFKFTGSTIDFNDVSLTGTKQCAGGAAVMNSSTVTFADCFITNHQSSVGGQFGIAFNISNGSNLICKRTTIADNGKYAEGGPSCGGAIYAVGNSNLVFEDGCRIINNSAVAYWQKSYGGAIYAEGGTITIRDCFFKGNYAKKRDGRSDSNIDGQDRHCAGGTIHARSGTIVDISDCEFIGGYTGFTEVSITDKNGGLIYLSGATTKAVITGCGFYGAGYRNDEHTGGRGDDKGSITVYSGSLYMTNVVMSTGKGNAVETITGDAYAELESCTLAGYSGAAVSGNSFSAFTGYGIFQQSGEIKVNNSIVLGNLNGDDFQQTTTAEIKYTSSLTATEKHDGLDRSNFFLEEGTDILASVFTDTIHCHLASPAGTYTNGFFKGGEWTTTTYTSPAIDMGDENLSYANEPQPHGYRINLGAYANTEVASKTPLDDEPAVGEAIKVLTYPTEQITLTGATFHIELASAGTGSSASVKLLVDTVDRGAKLEGWAKSYDVTSSATEWQKLIYTVSDLESGIYYYRAYVVNENNESDFSSPRTFETASKAAVTAPVFSHLYRTTLRFAVSVTDIGAGAPSTIAISYAPVDAPDQTEQSILVKDEVLTLGDEYICVLTGLTQGTTYNYTLAVSNGAGETTHEGTFTTLSDTASAAFYYTQNEGGTSDGTSWANGTQNIDTYAAELRAGDIIYIEGGTYLRPISFNFSSIPGVTFIGGYSQESGSDSDEPTIFKNTSAATRIFEIKDSAITFKRITFTGGNNISGAAVYATNSDLAFENCILTNNASSVTTRGGAIYSSGGSLTLKETTFADNRIIISAGIYGAAIYANGSVTKITDCTFEKNYLHSQHFNCYGGAIHAEGKGSLAITNTAFISNHVRQNEWYTQNNTGRQPQGGAIQTSVPKTDIYRCHFENNFARYYTETISDKIGGVIRQSGGTMVINQSSFYHSGCQNEGVASSVTDKGSITVSSGSLYMTNVVMSCGTGNAVETTGAGASVEMVNCTIAEYTGTGYADKTHGHLTAYALYQEAGTITVKNSILWGNKNGNYYNHNDGGTMTAEYTLSQEPMIEGEGNICKDPLFYDTKYCHLRSFAGVYTDDWFGDKGTWIKSRKNNSPAIDAGDPDSDKSNEPKPWGPRINLGAYGNTEVASKSWISMPTMMILR